MPESTLSASTSPATTVSTPRRRHRLRRRRRVPAPRPRAGPPCLLSPPPTRVPSGRRGGFPQPPEGGTPPPLARWDADLTHVPARVRPGPAAISRLALTPRGDSCSAVMPPIQAPASKHRHPSTGHGRSVGAAHHGSQVRLILRVGHAAIGTHQAAHRDALGVQLGLAF